ncbi:uncharacterized protein LOC101850023 [Aplysia californica]|uniref:Uncharacterized protein LOC101850023 n=1 Tax=Aplysia californica TaxID=6500 RepID=A0ABM0JXU9_APLCA|nr:uncharacterized protein LOC101850023 [Aplysia californica]
MASGLVLPTFHNAHHPSLTTTPQPGLGPLSRPPDVRPKERSVSRQERRTTSSLTSLNPESSTLNSSVERAPSVHLRRALREHKAVLDSVSVDESYLTSASVRAVEINLREYALPGERQLIVSAVRACAVRGRNYPKAAELLSCIIDADFEEWNIVHEFADFCHGYGGVENVPFFRHWRAVQGQAQGQAQGEGQVQGQAQGESQVQWGGQKENETVREGLSGSRAAVSDVATRLQESAEQPVRAQADVTAPPAAGTADVSTAPASGPVKGHLTSPLRDTSPTATNTAPKFEPQNQTTQGLSSNTCCPTSVDVNEIKIELNSSAPATTEKGKKSETSERGKKVTEKDWDEGRIDEKRKGGEEEVVQKPEVNQGHSETEACNRNKRPQLTQSQRREQLLRVLERERRYLKDKVTCSVCNSRPVETTFLPCSHLVSCLGCAKKCKKCPQCGKKVLAEAKTFIV